MSDTQVAAPAPATAPPPTSGPSDPLGAHFGVDGLMDLGATTGKLAGGVTPRKIAPIRDDKGKFVGGAVPVASAPAAPATMDDFAADRDRSREDPHGPQDPVLDLSVEAPPVEAAPPAEPSPLSELPGPITLEGNTFKTMKELNDYVARKTAAQSATDQKYAVLEQSLTQLNHYLRNTGLIDQIDFSKDPMQPAPATAKDVEVFKGSLVEDKDLLAQIGEDAARTDGAGPYIAAMRVATKLEAMVKASVDAMRAELTQSLQPHQNFLNAINQTTQTAEFLAGRAMAAAPDGAPLYPDIRDKKNVKGILQILETRFPDPKQALDPENFHVAYLLWKEKNPGAPTPRYEVPPAGPSDTVRRSAAAAVGGGSQAPRLGEAPKTKTPEEAVKEMLRKTPVSRGGFRT